METLYKKLTGKTAPSGVSSLWLKKQINWYGQTGKKFEKDIRQLLALDIKNKTAYQSGTKLVREYEHRSPDGSGACGVKKYEVLILDGCFVYEGMQYKSLSKIAEEITGTRWNGNLEELIMDREIKVLRAAVYVRKSSEEGLELHRSNRTSPTVQRSIEQLRCKISCLCGAAPSTSCFGV